MKYLKLFTLVIFLLFIPLSFADNRFVNVSIRGWLNQSGFSNFTGLIYVDYATGSTQCAQFNSNGSLVGSGTGCGGGVDGIISIFPRGNGINITNGSETFIGLNETYTETKYVLIRNITYLNGTTEHNGDITGVYNNLQIGSNTVGTTELDETNINVGVFPNNVNYVSNNSPFIFTYGNITNVTIGNATILFLRITNGSVQFNWSAEYFYGAGDYLTGVKANCSGLNSCSAIIYNNNASYINSTSNFAGDISGTYKTIELGTDVVGDTELDTTQVTLNDFTNDANFVSNTSDYTFKDGNITQNLTVIGNMTANLITATNLSGNIKCSQIQFDDGIGSSAICDGADATSGGAAVTGAGNTNNLSIWTSGTNLGNSSLYQTNSRIGLGTINPQATLHINDTGLNSGFIITNYTSQILRVNSTDGLVQIGLPSLSVNLTTGGRGYFADFVDAGNLFIKGLRVVLDADAFKRANVSEYLGGSDVNSSLLKVGNLSNIYTPLWNQVNNNTPAWHARYAEVGFDYTNASDFHGGQNSSLLIIANRSNILAPVWNSTNSKLNVTEINVTGGVGTANITIQNGSGTVISSAAIYHNGSGICIVKC